MTLIFGYSRRRPRRRSSRRAPNGAIAAGVLAAMLQFGTQLGASAQGPISTVDYTWPEFHHDPSLSGVSADPAISTSTAGGLTIGWMANTYAPILSSPIAQRDPVSGRMLAYVGNLSGDEFAFDTSNGQQVWSRGFAAPTLATPLVDAGALWVPAGSTIFKLDASTGATLCSLDLGGFISASPVIATPLGGSPTVYVGENSNGPTSGPLAAVSAADCTLRWTWSGYPCGAGCAGTWSPDSFGVDANGRALVVLGSDDPDSAVYAIDATTGQQAWRFQTPVPVEHDVGAGATISAPGINGFADGIAYIPGKDRILFALDLTNGSLVWSFDFGLDSHSSGSVTTPSLVGRTLVFGQNGSGYEYAVDAITGAKVWRYGVGKGHINVVSSSAVVGPLGHEVVAFGDTAGILHALRLSDGTQLSSFSVSGYISSSPAEVNGSLLFGSSNGFLYSVVPGTAPPESAAEVINNPVDGSSLANAGSVTINGNASDSGGVGQVLVAVRKDSASGQWWNASTSTWSMSPIGNAAFLASPGSPSTGWSITVPVATAGDTYSATVTAISVGHSADPVGARTSFYVQPTSGSPIIGPSSKWAAQHQRINLAGNGFAPGEMVAIGFGGTPALTVKATSTGALPAATPYTIPLAAPFGPTVVSAVGQTSGRATTTVVHVFNSWPQWRAGPTHSGFEVGDYSLTRTTIISLTNLLSRAWEHQTGAAIQGSPAVVYGVAYVGNASGTVSAINIRSNAVLWSVTLGGAVNSSPAVDGSLLIVGAADGTVSALNATSGTLVWQMSTGGSIESSPAVAGGVVYVGSDDGHLYALQEANGSILWSKLLAGAVRSSPAVDEPAGVVVVGDDGGTVTALTAAAGVILWSVPTGGPVDASPLIVSGKVFVGSSDHKFYAVGETSGTVEWTYTSGGAIHSSAGTSSGAVHFGSDDGFVYGLKTATGAVSLRLNVGSPVRGISEAIGSLFLETSTGWVYEVRAGYVGWMYKFATSLSGSPSVVDGAIYVGAGDGTLSCFSLFGAIPNS